MATEADRPADGHWAVAQGDGHRAVCRAHQQSAAWQRGDAPPPEVFRGRRRAAYLEGRTQEGAPFPVDGQECRQRADGPVLNLLPAARATGKPWAATEHCPRVACWAIARHPAGTSRASKAAGSRPRRSRSGSYPDRCSGAWLHSEETGGSTAQKVGSVPKGGSTALKGGSVPKGGSTALKGGSTALKVELTAPKVGSSTATG
jgi:hypothetical protein